MSVDERAQPALEVALREVSEERRRALIRSLSDAELVRTYMLLSDDRIAANVRALPDLLAQIRTRNLPIGRSQ